MLKLYDTLRRSRILNLFVINLRFLIGIGFLPSGIKKIINQPFANSGQAGVFFEYLDALHATGFYYQMVGWAQVIAAVLLITQRFATLGAFLFFPIIFNIMIFTWSTIGSLTPVIATLMFLGISFLLIWDYYKWINIFRSDNHLFRIPSVNNYPSPSKWWIYTGIILLTFPPIVIFITRYTSNSISIGQSFAAYLLLTGLIPVLSLIIHEIKHFVRKK